MSTFLALPCRRHLASVRCHRQWMTVEMRRNRRAQERENRRRNIQRMRFGQALTRGDTRPCRHQKAAVHMTSGTLEGNGTDTARSWMIDDVDRDTVPDDDQVRVRR